MFSLENKNLCKVKLDFLTFFSDRSTNLICMREGIYCSVYSRFKNLIYDKFTFSVFVTVVAVMAVVADSCFNILIINTIAAVNSMFKVNSRNTRTNYE